MNDIVPYLIATITALMMWGFIKKRRRMKIKPEYKYITIWQEYDSYGKRLREYMEAGFIDSDAPPDSPESAYYRKRYALQHSETGKIITIDPTLN